MADVVETSPNAEVHRAIRLLQVKGVTLVQIHHQLVEVFTAHCNVKETCVDGKVLSF
jgi:ABC-type sugar transport system ATPase subunit